MSSKVQEVCGSALVLFAALAAMWAAAALPGNAAEAAESRLLMLQAGFLFSGLALLGGRRIGDVAGALLLPLATVWLLPASSLRGTTFTAATLLAVGWVLHRRLAREPATTPLSLVALSGLSLAMPGWFAVRRLLVMDAATDAWPLIGLPLLIALGLWRLGTHWTRSRVLLLAACLWILGPGASLPMLLSVVLVLATEEIMNAAAASPASRHTTTWITVALATLVAAWATQGRLAVVLGIMALAILLRRHRRFGWALAGVSVVAAATLLGWSWGPHPGVLLRASFLLPATVVAIALGQPAALTAIALAAITSAVGIAPQLLAPAAALGLAALPARPSLFGAQQAWTTTLFAATATLASYPWFRSDLIRDAIGAFSWRLFDRHLVLLLLATTLAFAAAALVPWPKKERAGRRVMAVLLVAIACTSLAPVHTRVHFGPIRLHHERPRTRIDLADGIEAKRLVIESSVSNGYSIDAGTPIALVRTSRNDRKLSTRALRFGTHTGEWAAERPDIAAQFPSDGTAVWTYRPTSAPAFFARRYRSEWLLDGQTIDELKITLRQQLPEDFQLTIHRLELIE